MYKYIIPIGLLVISALCGYCYLKGYNSAKAYYETELSKARIDNFKAITSLMIEQDSKEKGIVTSYLAEIEQLKEEQTNEIETIKSTKLRDTTKCLPSSNTSSTRVSTEATTRPNTICYTESELLGKIKESMAIAGECDQLAIKYNSLLEVCNER